MTTTQIIQLTEILSNKGVRFDLGLTDDEVSLIELKFNLKFPPNLRLLFQTNLPVSDGFINWREGLISNEVADSIFSQLNWPLEGLLFDLQYNNFWVDAWGKKPEDYEEMPKIAQHYYAAYPKLIPIYFHRYMPDTPGIMGNPVFSVHQMDIVYYGYNLATYFANEFDFVLPSVFEIPDKPIRNIEFWSKWAEE